MHYHINIDPEYWNQRYADWHSRSVEDKTHRYHELIESINAWLKGNNGTDGVAMVSSGDLIKITVVDPVGLFTITPLFDPKDIIRDFLTLATDFSHDKGGAWASVMERANAYLNATPLGVQSSQPQHVKVASK